MLLGGLAQSWLATRSAGRLLLREFEDGSVCFDPETGETLLLSHLSSFLLDLWKQNAAVPLTRDQLLAEVLAADDSATDAVTAAELVDQSLNELQRAGLAASSASA